MLRVRFYAELNDHLPEPVRFCEMVLQVPDAQTVASMIGLQGVPLAEVDLILVNGESVAADHPVASGDRVSVYPVFESFDIATVQRLRPEPLRTPRFVLDVHLGKLCSLMRMLGFDVRFDPSCTEADLKAISQGECRTLLSRDRALIASKELVRAYRVRHQHPEDQIFEVTERFQLSGSVRPFTRCLLCNSTLEAKTSGEVQQRLPTWIRENYSDFWRCPTCARVYWRGSRYHRMRSKLLHLMEKS